MDSLAAIWDALTTKDDLSFLTTVVGGVSVAQAICEGLFHHNVAWEYFEDSDPVRAVFDEVSTGKGFLKFRHLDELVIRDRLIAMFPDPATRPILLLGHTHEVRQRAANLRLPAHDSFDWYVNSGAAGRFENVLWAVEIVDGVETVVSWSRPEPRFGAPQRRIYRPEETILGNVLLASESEVALPAPIRHPVWLPAVLHAMMARA